MTRETFPNYREGESFTFDHDDLSYHAIVNRLPNGEIGEIFVDAGKIGSSAYTIAKEAAVLFSLARQHGCPLAVIRAALPLLADGNPAGPTGMALKIADGHDADRR